MYKRIEIFSNECLNPKGYYSIDMQSWIELIKLEWIRYELGY
jgi:hypothetical protein